MPDQIDPATTEALITGGDPPPGLEPVATALRAIRETADQPVRPRADLAEQMAAGVFTATPERYPGPALGPQGRGLGAAVRRGVRATLHGLAAAPRRAVSLSLPAKLAAAVLAAGLVGIGSAGVAGVLPAPMQEGFRTVVETVTPYDFPQPVPPEGDPMGRTGSDTDPEPGVETGPSPNPARSEGSSQPSGPADPNPGSGASPGPVPGAGDPGVPADPDPPGLEPDRPGNPGQGNPGEGNPGQGNPGNPGQGNPGQGNPAQGNPGQGNPGHGNSGQGNGQGNPGQGNPG